MNKKQEQEMHEFITWHLIYQQKSLLWSKVADGLGLGGFAHSFQVEAADAFVHLRRILNYLMMRGAKVELKYDLTSETFNNLEIMEVLEALMELKKEGLCLAHKFSASAADDKDYTTVRFYEWFLIDFTQEMAETRQILDHLNIHPDALVRLDQKQLKVAEPDVETVKKPFSINAQ